jgi:hypothetical protein
MNKRVKAIVHKKFLIDSELKFLLDSLNKLSPKDNMDEVLVMYINLLNEVKGKVDSEYNKALGEL